MKTILKLTGYGIALAFFVAFPWVIMLIAVYIAYDEMNGS
jgi:hypothetical protein